MTNDNSLNYNPHKENIEDILKTLVGMKKYIQ